MSANNIYNALRITAATGTFIKPKDTPGILGSVNINKPIQGVVTISDGSSVIATLASGSGSPIGPQLLGPTAFASLRVSMTSAAEDITFLYQ